MLGVDDPDTLTAAHYLAVTLFAVGENEQARVLLEDTTQVLHVHRQNVEFDGDVRRRDSA